MQKSALVLSAGGSFAAYQVGAWRELSSWFKPDIVVGTSAGCLNAWAIASGMTAEELERLWMNPAMSPELRLRFPRSWRGGMVGFAKAESLIRNLHAGRKPQCEIGVVLTALPGLRQHLVTDGSVTADHLLGSCAIPFVLPMPRIDGRIWADGGLFDSVNVWAAAQMGATRIIAIDCWRPKPIPLIDPALGWVANRRRHTAMSPVRSVPFPPTVLIAPDGPLGSAVESLQWRPEPLRRWMERGAADVRAKKHFFRDMF